MRRDHSAPRATSSLCRLVLFPLAIAACGGSSSPDKEIETVSSWTATVRLALADYRRQRVPALYATELRDQARDALQASRQSFAAESLPAADHRRAAASLDSLQEALGGLDHALLAP